METFQLKADAKIMGDKHPDYGYSYWATTDKGFVMFSSHQQNILEGTQITAQESEDRISKTAKKTAYKFLKKVKISGSQETVAHPSDSAIKEDSTSRTSPAADPTIKQMFTEVISKLDDIYKLLQKDPVVDVDLEEEITEEDIPY